MLMKKEKKDTWRLFLTEVTGGLLIILAMTLLTSLMGSCKTVERENIVTKTDTVRIYSQHKDSVVYRDSVFVHLYERGDTVYHVTERWNVRYNDRVRVDTVYKVREVAQQSKEVAEKKEPWYDNFLAKVLLCLLAGAVLVGVIKMTNNKA
jgi:hypothetical protein